VSVPSAGSGSSLWLRFLSGPDIDALAISNSEIIAAVQEAVLAHGTGQVVVEPRVHLVPDNAGAGHFNVLRGHLSLPGVSGVKVVGDFVANYAAGLPSELGLLTLYDPRTGVPLAILDATLITAARTGAMTAVGARFLARPEDAREGLIDDHNRFARFAIPLRKSSAGQQTDPERFEVSLAHYANEGFGRILTLRVNLPLA